MSEFEMRCDRCVSYTEIRAENRTDPLWIASGDAPPAYIVKVNGDAIGWMRPTWAERYAFEPALPVLCDAWILGELSRMCTVLDEHYYGQTYAGNPSDHG